MDWACPNCHGRLESSGKFLLCPGCKRRFFGRQDGDRVELVEIFPLRFRFEYKSGFAGGSTHFECDPTPWKEVNDILSAAQRDVLVALERLEARWKDFRRRLEDGEGHP